MIVKSIEDMRIVHEGIINSDIVAIDVETNGLNPRKDLVIGIGLSTSEEDGFYIPVYTYKDEKLIESEWSFVISHLLNHLHGKKLVNHNIAFDADFILNCFGVDLTESIYCDTMLLKHTVDEEDPFALKKIAQKLFGDEAVFEDAALHQSIKDNGGESKHDIYKADPIILAKYCIKDCQLALKLYNHYSKILESENLVDFFYNTEVMPLYKTVIIPMQRNGIPLDLELLKKSQVEISDELINLEAAVLASLSPFKDEFDTWYLDKEFKVTKRGGFAQSALKYYNESVPLGKSGSMSLNKKNLEFIKNPELKKFLVGESDLDPEIVLSIKRIMNNNEPTINIKSKSHLQYIFFNIFHESPISYTEKGQPQVDEDFLESMKEKYPVAKDLLLYFKLYKIKSTYIDRFLEEQEYGVFYPYYKIHGTLSGRLSSNFQQLPRKIEDERTHPSILKYNHRIRNFFVSGDGYSFIDSDYESLEPHVFSHVSGDSRIQEIFHNGLDFYSTIAIRTEKLEGVSADKKAETYLGKVNKTKRQLAKVYSLGIPYGMGGYALAKNLDIETSEGESLVRKYLEAFPDLSNWMQESDKKCLDTGFIASQAGRIRHMPEAKELWTQYGSMLLDPLKLWEEYNQDATAYRAMKEKRRWLKNYLNNAKNFQIQSLSASIVNRACISIAKYIKENNLDAYICGQIHDEILVICNDNFLDKLVKPMQTIMENILELDVALKAPPQVAKKYGEAK